MIRSQPPRAAHSLIELMITITAGSTLMILAVGMVHQTMSLSSMSHEHGNQAQARTRLAGVFRRDVHLAESCSLDSEQQLTLKLPDGQTVQYTVTDNKVGRERSLDEGVQRESFEFSPQSAIRFGLLDKPERVVVTVVRNMISKSAQPRVENRVAAVLGRRLMIQQAESSP